MRYVDVNVEAIKQREGGADNAIRKLARENKKYRDRNNALKVDLEKATTTGSLKQGEVKLSPEDAKKWEGFTKLAKTPEELGAVLKEHTEFGGKLAATEKATKVATASKAARFNQAALQDLIDTKQLNLVLQKEQVDGKDVEVPYIKPAGENAALVKLTEYVDKHLAVYKPALLAPASAGGTNGTGGDAQGANGEARRTLYPEQGAGGGSGNGSGQPTTGSTGITTVPGVQPRVLPSQRNAAPATAEKK